MRDVSLRSVPERMVASISRHVTASEVDAFFDDAFSRLRAFGAGLEGITGAPFVVYYGEVSQDSDGPVELCRPVAPDTAPGAAPAIQDIQVRVDPAHDEAYIRLTPAEVSWPAMLPAIDALEHWGRDNDRTPRGPLRQVIIADMRTAGPDTLVCDLSIPLR